MVVCKMDSPAPRGQPILTRRECGRRLARRAVITRELQQTVPAYILSAVARPRPSLIRYGLIMDRPIYPFPFTYSNMTRVF